MKYRVNASATYWLEFEVEADSIREAKNKGADMAADELDDADEWNAHSAFPIAPAKTAE